MEIFCTYVLNIFSIDVRIVDSGEATATASLLQTRVPIRYSTVNEQPSVIIKQGISNCTVLSEISHLKFSVANRSKTLPSFAL